MFYSSEVFNTKTHIENVLKLNERKKNYKYNYLFKLHFVVLKLVFVFLKMLMFL